MGKLYETVFTFDPADYRSCGIEIKSVGLLGSFCFYKSGLTGHTDETGMVDCDEYFAPSQYDESLDNIGKNYYQPMEKQEDGTWSLKLMLPANLYSYNFVINPVTDVKQEPKPDDWTSFMVNVITEGGREIALMTMKSRFMNDPSLGMIVKDAKNDDHTPTLDGYQANSIVYVGEDEYSWLPVKDASKKGTVTYQAYVDIEGHPRTFGVYLPAGYDKKKTYPVIVVSHGGGGNESDWVVQGGIANTMDNLIASGKTKEAILLMPSNANYLGQGGPTDWQFQKIADNTEKCVLPMAEKIYNISSDKKDRAFCGLSMGSMTTLYMYYHRSSVYQYFGAFSGGMAEGFPGYDISDPGLKDVTLMIGSAEEDIAYNQETKGVPPTIRCLKAAGLPIQTYFTTASHDWYCWPQMFDHFASEVVWH